MKIIMPADMEELALPLNGKKNRLKRTDFERFAVSLNLNPIQVVNALIRILNSVEKNLSSTLAASFLQKETKNGYQEPCPQTTFANTLNCCTPLILEDKNNIKILNSE